MDNFVTSKLVPLNLHQLRAKQTLTLSEWIREVKPDIQLFQELHKKKAFRCEWQDGKRFLIGDSRGLTPYQQEYIRALKEVDFLSQLEVMIQMEMFATGPKVFRPTAHQMFMLEQMTLNLNISELQLPFKVMAVELPLEYIEARKLPDFRPHISILYRDMFLVHSIWSADYAIKSWWGPTDPEQHVEEWFTTESLKNHTDGALISTQEEMDMEIKIRRAIVNYCLLLDEVGIKKDGPSSPNQYAQLVKWCQKNNKHTARNRAELTAQPIIYSPVKETKLVRLVKNESELDSELTGRKISPHCRRGYYRMQRYGVGRTEKKRIRIPPVMVNAHLLAGEFPIKVYQT